MRLNRLLPSILAFIALTGTLTAQRVRLGGPIDNAKRIRLAGHLHPNARSADDLGRLPASERISSVTLVFSQSPEQQAALDRLLAEQQDPASPNYHRWLSPEEFGDRFGISQDDAAKVQDWLEQQNLKVTSIARARTSISFSGAAGDIENAFRTELHRYRADGKSHFANATEPSIPADIEPLVRGIHGLHNFRMEPRARKLQANYTSTTGNHYLSPGDLAVIYNIKPLHDAGFTGAGQKIVVPGQSQIDLADLQQFRTRFHLPPNDPELILVPYLPDPGVSSEDLGEANLDLQWAAAVVPDAKLIYVYSENVMDAVEYAIDQNLAPVISLSYGLCELQMSRSQALVLQSWARQGNAQGITWLNASGDSGGADCVRGTSTAYGALAVDLPAAIPEITGVGGTEFNSFGGTYWNTTNSESGVSALSYIPEAAWNDSVSGNPASGGGGASTFFAKPAWQSGPGVPNDGARNVPDVALTSSAQNVGYLVYSEGRWQAFGGTSAATPAFAGITVLLNQYLVASGTQPAAGLGNINPRLYTLAQTTPGVFHDVIEGDNIVTVDCGPRARNCTSGSYGYAATPGYDQATGLGSVDAWQLVMAWRSQFGTPRSAASMALFSSATNVSWNDNLTLTATVIGQNGATPQGSVTFFLNTVPLGSASLTGSGGRATATLTIGAPQLLSGGNTITAEYSGNNTFEAAKATVVVTVTPAISNAPPSIAGVANGASFRQTSAPGALVSVFGSQLAPALSSARSVPLPLHLAGVSVTVNGVAAPLYYVSPGQVNLQIPYETPVGSRNLLVINNNGQSASAFVNVTAAAPGVFTDAAGAIAPTNTAARGRVIEMYVTGAGVVSPVIATGAAPVSQTPVANLPKPLQSARVAVGEIEAPMSFIGVPVGLVGVVQINFQVPSGAALGPQPVVVTIGGVASAPAILTVTEH